MTRRVIWMFGVLMITQPRAAAQEPPSVPEEDHPADIVHDDPRDIRKGPEIGIRFTPAIAAAMSKKVAEGMKPKYELDDAQTEKISRVVQQQLLRFVHENAVIGRDIIEMMMAVSIEHEGKFPKEDAERFAKLAKPFIPKLRQLFTDCSMEIGKEMSLKQRLKFTGDMAMAAAGIGVFEARMNRWEEGKVGEFANPFFDSEDRNDPAAKEASSGQYERTKNDVEKYVQYQIHLDDKWQEYLDEASRYFQFNDTQKTAAAAILTDCRTRAKAIKTPEWQSAVKELQVVSHMSSNVSNYKPTPWTRSIDASIKKLRAPMVDLDTEFRKRIDELADSQQRARARENMRKALEEKGLKQLPPGH